MDTKTPTTEKFYITKYALTQCPFVIEAISKGTACGHQYASTIGLGFRNAHHFHRIGKDAFRTWEEALRDCEKKRTAKLKSLNKSIEAVKALVFEKPKD